MTARSGHRRAPGAALLWALLLLAAQTLAVVHAHADGPPEAPCVVCPLAQAQTAAADSGPALPLAAPPPRMHLAVPPCALRPAEPPAPYRSRAPPSL